MRCKPGGASGRRPLRGRSRGEREETKRMPKHPLGFLMMGNGSEVLDDLHDLGADALLGFHGGGANMSGRLENVPVAHF